MFDTLFATNQSNVLLTPSLERRHVIFCPQGQRFKLTDDRDRGSHPQPTVRAGHF